jgi:phospholipid-binding lipoprotein MlaA
MNTPFLHLRLFLVAALSLLSSACATLEGPPNPDDPYEGFNRTVFEFNDTVDEYAFKPLARGYNFVMPDFASKGVTNFFNNLDDIVVFFNQIFQFKLRDAAATSARLVFNTTFGLLGLIDVATDMGLEKKNEDFGQTLAVWGVGSGNYVVLPFIGPSTIRDTAGLAVDWTYFDPVLNNQSDVGALMGLTIKYIDVRAGLLKASNILEDTVPDRYAFVRDAWLSQREFLIYDGNPPLPEDSFSEDELFKDENLFEDENLFRDEGLDGESPLPDELSAPTTDTQPDPKQVKPTVLNEPRMKSNMEIILEGGRTRAPEPADELPADELPADELQGDDLPVDDIPSGGAANDQIPVEDDQPAVNEPVNE